MKLDYVLGLKVQDFLERRLQTQVFTPAVMNEVIYLWFLLVENWKAAKHFQFFISFIILKGEGKKGLHKSQRKNYNVTFLMLSQRSKFYNSKSTFSKKNFKT